MSIDSLWEHLGVETLSAEWRELAKCNGLDTNLFFDEYEDNPVVREQINSMCSKCPVRKECLRSGLLNKETGVWGGKFLYKGEVEEL